jgi:hypothetical protein
MTQLILLSRVHAENAETQRIAVRLAAEGAAQGTRARLQAAIDHCAVCSRALIPLCGWPASQANPSNGAEQRRITRLLCASAVSALQMSAFVFS